MKRLTSILTAVLVMAAAQTGMAQMKADAAGKSGGTIPLGLGATFIDGETWYLVNLAPELSLGKLGFGLDLNLRISPSGKLRPGEYETFSDYLRIIRYVRWGHKGDPFYTRVGQLDYSMLGHGSIVYLYRNSASYDLRRTGIELDLNFEQFGTEMVLSDVAHAGLFGIRGYVRPLKFTSLAKIPVINNLEVGATFASDFDANANKTWGAGTTLTRNAVDNGSLAVYGFDLGLPIIRYSILSSDLYLDFAKIGGYGSGTTAGISLKFSGLGLVTMDAKYERRFNGAEYLPAYFNALYERDRFATKDSFFTSKAQTLKGIKASDGYYGEMVFTILGTLKIIGGYQAPLGVKNQGLLHMETQLPEIAGIVARAAYDKKNVGTVFTFDDNVLMTAELGYKVTSFMLVSTVYQRTFTKDDKGDFVKQDRVEPKVSFVLNF